MTRSIKNDETVNPLPTPKKRRIYLLAGVVEVADDEFDRLNSEMTTLPEIDLLKSLERQFYTLTTRRGDPEVSLEIIRMLMPLYDVESRQIASHLEQFFSKHQAVIHDVYEQAEDDIERSAYLYQPEALMIYDRLCMDPISIRQVWSARYPERELERIANAFGISFD